MYYMLMYVQHRRLPHQAGLCEGFNLLTSLKISSNPVIVATSFTQTIHPSYSQAMHQSCQQSGMSQMVTCTCATFLTEKKPTTSCSRWHPGKIKMMLRQMHSRLVNAALSTVTKELTLDIKPIVLKVGKFTRKCQFTMYSARALLTHCLIIDHKCQITNKPSMKH